MKKYLIASLLCVGILCSRAFGQTAELDVTNGLTDLANQDIVDANANFQLALTLEPTNEDANVLLAITRLLVAPQTPTGSNFLNSLNFNPNGRDIYNWTSSPPKDVYGGPVFPANYNSTNIVYFFRTNIMPLIAASLTNLANLTDTNFLLTFDVGETNLGQVTIDYGDVQLGRAMLTAADAFGYTLDANNASVILPQIVTWGDTNGLTIQRVLAGYPSLLTPHNTNDLLPSENDVREAIALYLAASDFIRNDRLAEDTNDLVTISPDEVTNEEEFRVELTNVLSSLDAPTQFDPNDPDSVVNLGRYFSGGDSLRKSVPQFNGDAYVDNTLPDYTFGGILPDEPPYKTEAALRQAFPSRAGIYTGESNDGTNGLSDSNGGTGGFVVYVDTNGVATLFGYDNGGFGSPFTFLFQINFNAQGDWQFSNSTVVASANVDKHGDFNADLTYSNGLSVSLYANEQSPTGPFQNNAGFYSGNFSGSSSGTLDGVLAADGELFYIPLVSGKPQVGGNGQFYSATQITIDSSDGTIVQGTLNPNTSAISGTYSNSGNGSHGPFTMSRSKKVNLDVPPIITANLPANVLIPLGNTLKLTLGVSGSAPLSYQWYFQGAEDPLISGAISNTLVISNNVLQTTGQYQIWATVNNLAGGTTSQVTTVTVALETNKPTITITSPKSNQLWSNATFNVTGTTSDKLGITGVYYYINNGSFGEAITTNNWASWSATNVMLTPGTNIIYAYAYNVGGIAATNSVKMVYVQTALLTVLTNGQGTITPPYPSPLRVGEVYSLTAAPRPGYRFVCWFGGTNQPFSFYTNGPKVDFAMSNNLTMEAYLENTNTLFPKITNATSGMHVTNMAFTVMGIVTDSVAVASVNYSLNGGPFTPATPRVIANGVSWSAPLMLPSGTNTFAVYATDVDANVSGTNSIIIIRQPSLSLFPIATGDDLTHPQGEIAFDGTNYLVVFSAGAPMNGAVGQFVSPSGALVGSLLDLNPNGSDDPPYLDFDGANYLVAWADYSNQSNGVPVNGVLVSPAGSVGSLIQLSQSTTVANFSTIVYGGGVYFLMWEDSSTSPDSIYGAIVDTSGNNLSGDFPISPSGREDEAASKSAAFDGTHFLAVWASATGNTSINGQLIDTSGNLVGSPVLIYTNSAPASVAVPCVVFDGTKYLVLFNTGLNTTTASSFHILGRFVTTAGEVLTNQITLTSDTGPQIIAGADFDGLNYLVSWNQGLNPFALTASATINGRFFNSNGVPTTAEFPIFKTQGSLIPTWAPVLYDGVNSQFVLPGGLGKMISPAGADSGFRFTNGIIDGAFVLP